MKHYLLLFLVALFGCTNELELPETKKETPFAKCNTEKYCEKLLEDDNYRRRFESDRNTFRNIEAKSDCNEVNYIALAFHITDSTVVDNQENRACLEALLQQQVDLLNADFSAKNADIGFWNNVDDLYPNTTNRATCIQFVLADKNHPNNRLKTPLEEGKPAITIGEYPHGQTGVGAWAGYLNVWVYPIGGNILGFAPLGGRGIGDGVAINSFAIGGAGSCGNISSAPSLDRGRTLSHEIGHYFFLFHVWGDGCEQDDDVADTPNSEGPNWGCPGINKSSCGSLDLHMNYMDYVNDECMYMFSAGQSTRMEAWVDRRLQNLTQKAPNVSTLFDVTEPEGPINEVDPEEEPETPEEEEEEEETDDVDEEETPPTPPTDTPDDDDGNQIPAGVLGLLIAGVLGLIAWIFNTRPDVKDAVDGIMGDADIIKELNRGMTSNFAASKVEGIQRERFQKGRLPSDPLVYPLTSIPSAAGGRVVCPKIGKSHSLKDFDFSQLPDLYDETLRARAWVLAGKYPQWLIDKYYPFQGKAPQGLTAPLRYFDEKEPYKWLGLSADRPAQLCDVVHMDDPDDVTRVLLRWLLNEGLEPVKAETNHITFLESIPDAQENICDGAKYGLHRVFEYKYKEGVPRPEEIYEYLTGKDGKFITAYPEGCPKHPEHGGGHAAAAAGGASRLIRHFGLEKHPKYLKVVLDTVFLWGMFRQFAGVHYGPSTIAGIIMGGLGRYIRAAIRKKDLA